jgi:hydrogenase/urease accessory protein HupE
MPLLALCLVSCAAAALALPGAALAHGLPGSNAETIGDYLWLGIRHMLAGWDHLLFIAGIVILAGTLGRAAKLISLFVLGHSLTLLVATLAGWKVDAAAVDVLIAASVAYIGLRIVRGRPTHWGHTAAAIFVFGLAHGLGLSTRLQELPLPDGAALVARIIAFNIGVEIGQLAALSLMVGAGLLLARFATRLRTARRPAGAALAATGLIAAAVLGVVALQPDETNAAGSGSGDCTEGSGGLFFDDTGTGGHPAKPFFGPDETPPGGGDLQHVMGDGYIIISYRKDLPLDDVGTLEQWTSRDPRGIVVLPAAGQGSALRAVTVRHSIACRTVDLDRLSEF